MYDRENRLVDLTLGGLGTEPRTIHIHPGTADNHSTEDRAEAVFLTVAPDQRYTYAYDYRTRRVLRDESAAGGDRTYLGFAGGTSVREWTDNGDAAFNPAVDILTVEYVRGSDYGGGIGGLLYSLRSGIPSYKHYNSRGDVVAATDAIGSLTYQAAYEAFGRHGDTPGSYEWGDTADRQQANTKDEDPTGLLNEGFRYRCLETGTFITRDPLGFVDGPNVYTYVVQNPWTRFDPLGLKFQYGGDDATDEQRDEIKKDMDKMYEENKDKSETYRKIYEEMRDDKDNIFVAQKVEDSAENIYGGKIDDGKYYFEYQESGNAATIAHEGYHALQSRESDRVRAERGQNSITSYSERIADPLNLGVAFENFDKNPWINPVDNNFFRHPGTTTMADEGPAVRVQNRVNYEILESERLSNPNARMQGSLRNSYPIGNKSGVVINIFGTGGKWDGLNKLYEDRNMGNFPSPVPGEMGPMRPGAVQRELRRRK